MSTQVGRAAIPKAHAQAAYVSEVTTGIVDRHLKGFQDARALAWNCSRATGSARRMPSRCSLPSNTALPVPARSLTARWRHPIDLARAFRQDAGGQPAHTGTKGCAYSDVLRDFRR